MQIKYLLNSQQRSTIDFAGGPCDAATNPIGNRIVNPQFLAEGAKCIQGAMSLITGGVALPCEVTVPR